MAPKKDRKFDFTRYFKWGLLATGLTVGFILLLISSASYYVSLSAANMVGSIVTVELIYILIYLGLKSTLTRFVKSMPVSVLVLGLLTFSAIELFNILTAFAQGQPYYSSQFSTNFWTNRVYNALASLIINAVIYWFQWDSGQFY